MNDFTPDLAANSLPPQNIEAEEIILGSLLFDPNAMGKVIDLLPPEAFYVNAHRQIYEAARNLYFQGQPIDLMTVSTWLSDRSLLDKIGGTPKILNLLDRTVSSANIERYIPLVTDKYIRRLLIGVAKEIGELGYDTTKELDHVLDASEQKIFSLTQARVQQGLVAISDTLINTFTEIQNFQEKTAVPGISTDFYDLDALTGGLQRSDLIIIAGRPAMGKCLAQDSEIVLSDGSLVTIQELYQRRQAQLLTLQDNYKFAINQASQFIDDGIKPVFRVTTKLDVRQIETTITHPYLTITGWKHLSSLQVGDKIAVPRQINTFGEKSLPDYQAKLLAYFIGDGCLTRSCPEFTNSNPLLQFDFIQSVKNFSGVAVKRKKDQGKRTPSFSVISDAEFIKVNRESFAHSLAKTINSQSLSNRQLAEYVNVSPASITHWQKGICVPEEKNFLLLCQILDIKPEKLTSHELSAISKNSKNPLTIWLEKLGLWGKSAHQKTIPLIIFQLKPSLIALFLNRLFATDGWASVYQTSQVQIGYCTVSEKLARQVQHLLLRFGIISHLKQKSVKYNEQYTKAWQIKISDARAIKIFIAKIGIFGKEKALSAIKNILSNKKYQTNCDLIPVEIWQQINIAKGEESWQSLAKRARIKGYSNLHVGKRALSRQRLHKLAVALDNLPLQQIATSEVYWDEIVSIEYTGKQQVYDLTIRDTHNFVANDICVHNTSFALNIAANVAKEHDLSVAIFSLEMSRDQLAMRLLSAEARLESSRLKSGRITEREMEPLMEAMGNLSELPIYIDDTANITVMQMRSEVRRLQAEKKGKLGLVLIDYLQLMEGTSDNRVQELSRITRSLKGLAREVNTPIIALSQLSRAVEQRTNKRPMLSDLRECITGDTLVFIADRGYYVPVKKLLGQKDFYVSALNDELKLEKSQCLDVWETGEKEIFEVTTQSGMKIKTSINHPFYTINGWKELKDISSGDFVASARSLPSNTVTSELKNEEIILLAHMIGDGCFVERQPIHYTSQDKNSRKIVAECAKTLWGTKARVVQDRNSKNCFHVYLPSPYRLTRNKHNPFVNLLKKLHLNKSHSFEKKIPDLIFISNKKQIAMFIRHLWSTDGGVSIRQTGSSKVYYSSNSISLITDL